jgi:ribosome assembly protein 1
VFLADTNALEKGLAKLSLADGAVEVTLTAKGERILACLGEIHLEQSILDLKNIYCGKEIDLRISKPIVDFGESTAWFEGEVSDFEQFYKESQLCPPLRQTSIPPYCYEDGLVYAKRGRSRAIISGRSMACSVRVIPLPRCVYNSLHGKAMLDGSEEDIVSIGNALNYNGQGNKLEAKEILEKLLASVTSIDNKGNAMIESEGLANGACIKGVFSENSEIYIPPNKGKDKMFTQKGEHSADEVYEASADDRTHRVDYEYIKAAIAKSRSNDDEIIKYPADIYANEIWQSNLRPSAQAGFLSGCSAGPLCEEPIRGILVVLEGVELALRKKKDGSGFEAAQSISGGMVVAALRTGIRSAILTRPVRLVEGHLRLTLHSSLTGLGPLYAILSKRRGRVISDTMVEGTDLISITATLPQIESFGLAPELMEKSSGDVTAPELVFSHWAVFEEDPFWIPTSLEEREDYGEIILNGDSSTGIDNNALKYIRMVRDRKGLMVDSNKIVVAAEKQRTLARKK